MIMYRPQEYMVGADLLSLGAFLSLAIIEIVYLVILDFDYFHCQARRILMAIDLQQGQISDLRDHRPFLLNRLKWANSRRLLGEGARRPFQRMALRLAAPSDNALTVKRFFKSKCHHDNAALPKVFQTPGKPASDP